MKTLAIQQKERINKQHSLNKKLNVMLLYSRYFVCKTYALSCITKLNQPKCATVFASFGLIFSLKLNMNLWYVAFVVV